MADENGTSETAMQKDHSTDLKAQERRELSRIANKASKRAAETVQRYDGEHGIFSK
jgi:hypothetical protein